jgi:hypothetical protein
VFLIVQSIEAGVLCSAIYEVPDRQFLYLAIFSENCSLNFRFRSQVEIGRPILCCCFNFVFILLFTRGMCISESFTLFLVNYTFLLKTH